MKQKNNPKSRSKPDKVHAVMGEFKRGKLHSGSGDVVKDKKQAVAIAMSEARKAYAERELNKGK